MITFRWLHLTDLHAGMQGQRWLWPSIEPVFLEDLARIADPAAPIDLVLFTGDLTQRGEPAEFDRLNEVLTSIYNKLDALQGPERRPPLLAVPGNHDLTRPGEVDPSVVVLTNKALRSDTILEQLFQPASPYARVIHDAFRGYTDWWSRHPFPRLPVHHNGALPGDFSALYDRGGLRLGIVGLNSAFLQLTAQVREGDLLLSPRQFHEACEGNGARLLEGCNLGLLLTHHPPEWLDPDNRRDALQGQIAPPGRFALHLCGHQHENAAISLGLGGAEPLRRFQARSLFGLERIGGALHRNFGYALGQIQIDEQARLRLFPRRAVLRQGGHFGLDRDPDFELQADGGTTPEVVHLRRPAQAIAQAPRRPPHPPGAPYSPDWYVSRPREEQAAMGALLYPGCPVVVLGGPQTGKHWFLSHLLYQSVRGDHQQGKQSLHVRIDLKTFSQQDLETLNTLLYEIASRIIAGLDLEGRLVDEAWARPGGPQGRLLWLLGRKVLPEMKGQLFLALERLDRIRLPMDQSDEFSGLLRSIAQLGQSPPWDRLRLLISQSTTSVLESADGVWRSPLGNIVNNIVLQWLMPEQVRQLANHYGVALHPSEEREIEALVAGHPYFVRLLLYLCRIEEISVGQVLRDAEHRRRMLEQVRENFADLPPRALDALRALSQGGKAQPEPDLQRQLLWLGVLQRAPDDQSLSFRCQLFRDHFRGP